ncbi:hypothetical protein VB716_05785 [Synechococcus sp. CCY9201]|uniref:hypothetical protein n=1 Tax=Synechococcus sp. CCY9201 TaxID=174697 RepID=UPI002B1F439B|nr:hypothetical protein [Synechococcus sp. CCY9201]MEA5473727.1 hypothetical protein [Synechococcus sp. CCY9201]
MSRVVTDTDSAAPLWLSEPARMFPEQPYRDLLAIGGVTEPVSWVQKWKTQLAHLSPAPTAHPSLLWGGWLPLLERCRQLVDSGERHVLGLNGPIGAGKSTLLALITRLARELDLPIAVASIDDLYLPWTERKQAMAGNPFGVLRGPPGSHDPALAQAAIAQWRRGGTLVLPRFDKRLRQGEGDRCGQWQGEPQLLLLDGWLLGCREIPEATLQALLSSESYAAEKRFAGTHSATADRLISLIPTGFSAEEQAWLPIWNCHLKSYQPLWQELSALWQLRPQRWSLARRWRFQAEARQRRLSGSALPMERLEGLVRSCLYSLPPNWYQNLSAEAVILLDSRRRCLWSGPGPQADLHPQSALESSSATG